MHPYASRKSFNTQPPEGGWITLPLTINAQIVSTHSRPKAADEADSCFGVVVVLFQHTAARRRLTSHHRIGGGNVGFQHTAARRRLNTAAAVPCQAFLQFQHTAARRRLKTIRFGHITRIAVSTHSRPKAADSYRHWYWWYAVAFQHTAARRRLTSVSEISATSIVVSTHSRPKAAENAGNAAECTLPRFNTQPPEGG